MFSEPKDPSKKKMTSPFPFTSRASIILGLLLGLLGVGTVGFHAIEGWGWFQSFYATMMTISTIGGDPENQLSHSGEVFNVVLIFMGLCVVGFAVGSLTTAVVEFELGSFFGRRRMEKEISRLKNHFIICGAGRVGRHIAMEIHDRNLPMIVVEKDPDRAQWVQAQEIPLIIGDASSEQTLREARIEHARGLASAVTSDAQNVYIVLTARGLAPGLPIIARASEDDAESKLLRAGATSVVSPYHYAGENMARQMTRPNVQRFIDLAFSPLGESGLGLQIEEIQVGGSSKLAGSNLAAAQIRTSLGIIVLAIRSDGGQLQFNPGPEQTIVAGDFLIAMGDPKRLKELESLAGAG
jgi:voltage-gated potassium channel